MLAKTGDFEESEKMAQMAIQYYELTGSSVPWDVYYHVAMAQDGLNQTNQALASYKKAIEAAQNNIPQKERGEIDAAIERLSK